MASSWLSPPIFVWYFEVVSDRKFDKLSSASFYDVHDHRGCACTHREPPPRAQTPPNTTPRCCNEVVRVRAPERARSRGRGHLGRHGALAASETVKRVDAFAAPSRGTAAGPPTQVEDRTGHADFGVGIKFQTALVKVHAICNSLRDFHTGPTRRSSRPRSSTSPSAARNWTTTRRRSRLLESRRTTRCAPSPSR